MQSISVLHTDEWLASCPGRFLPQFSVRPKKDFEPYSTCAFVAPRIIRFKGRVSTYKSFRNWSATNTSCGAATLTRHSQRYHALLISFPRVCRVAPLLPTVNMCVWCAVQYLHLHNESQIRYGIVTDTEARPATWECIPLEAIRRVYGQIHYNCSFQHNTGLF